MTISFSTTDFSFDENGFCREYTAAAKAVGFTDEELAAHDRRAAQIIARDRLFNCPPELVTSAMVEAAGYTPYEWQVFTGQMFENIETPEADPPKGETVSPAPPKGETVSPAPVVVDRDPRGRKSAPAGCIEIARRMDQEGKSLREISRALEIAGFLSPSGKAYWPASIQKMLG